MKLPRIHDLIEDMEVRYRQSGLGRVDPADEEYELLMIHKDLLKDIRFNHKILDVRIDDILRLASNAKELVRDIYANIILLDAHYQDVTHKQINEGEYDYLFKNHWVHEIQGDEEE